MAQKDEMSPRALEMEELENVNGGNGGSSPLPGEGLPTGKNPVDVRISPFFD